VQRGRFREDLFYRLNVYPIPVPPLRERREDVAPLARHFLARFSAAEAGGRVRAISPRALAVLEAYDWPGNIRQLENAVFRATVLCDGDTLTEAEFPQIRAQVEGTIDLGRYIDPPAAPEEDAAEPEIRPEHGEMAAAPGVAGVRALDEKGEIRSLADVELDMILLAIDRYGGQMSEVARRLGIGRSTLYRKFKEYGIDPETGRPARLAS